MMTEQAALAKKDAAAAATLVATTTKPFTGTTSATADAEAGAASASASPEGVTLQRRTSAKGAAARAAKSKVARNMSDMTCRFVFPLLYGLFVVAMFGSIEAYGHRSECDWD